MAGSSKDVVRQLLERRGDPNYRSKYMGPLDYVDAMYVVYSVSDALKDASLYASMLH